MPPKNCGAPQSLADEDLAVNKTLPDTDRVYEITINIPRTKTFKSASREEWLDMYKTLWTIAKDTIPRQVSDQYVVEYCQDGFPHIHGYLSFNVNMILTDEYIIGKLAKKIFKHLPRSAWKQLEQNPYNTYYKRFKSPALVINAKTVLSSTWLDYMNKNAQPKN